MVEPFLGLGNESVSPRFPASTHHCLTTSKWASPELVSWFSNLTTSRRSPARGPEKAQYSVYRSTTASANVDIVNAIDHIPVTHGRRQRKRSP